ncbi:MAG UNVERIFIED_CONTAM: hypothetical protein LVR18_34765 [Planctomycetaceae bacterium]
MLRQKPAGITSSKMASPLSDLIIPRTPAAITVATRHHQQLPVLPKAPCNGPGCRKQTLPLAPPPAAPASVTASDPAVLLDSLLSANTCVDGIVSTQSETGEHWVASEVFRPPTA